MQLLKTLDSLLNGTTMYRVVLYALIIISSAAIFLSFTGNISFSITSLTTSMIIFVLVSYYSNIILSKIFHVIPNVESSIITGLILFLIMQPATDIKSGLFLILISASAMLSKYIFSYKKTHILNPAAITAFIFGLFSTQTAAIWWVATPNLLPFTLLLGLLVVRKTRRFLLFLTFLTTSFLIIITNGLIKNSSPLFEQVTLTFTAFPLIFFGTIMLTEPRTMPTFRKHQIIFGTLVGLLFGLPFQLGNIYITPELSLIIGNIFAFFIFPRNNLVAYLTQKTKLTDDIYNFTFKLNNKLKYYPGQYLEWTIGLKKPDLRGNRRFFTIASSPTEENLQLGVKIVEKSSSFKKNLLNLKINDSIITGALSGDFILPKDPREKLIFIAGGIGITPFRSMIKYLIDTNQKRDIILFYVCSNPNEFVYKDFFDQASLAHLLTVRYVISHSEFAPKNWYGLTGRLTPEIIKDEVLDYDNRKFYLSGPNAMVHGYKEILEKLMVKKSNILTDYFPGF